MVSNEAFIPQQTKVDTRVPTYGPRPQTHVGNLSIEDDSDLANIGLIETSSRHMLFCGCCDFRRATLVINGISIVFNIITMIFILVMVDYVKEHIYDIENEIDDDEYRQSVDSFVKGGDITIMEYRSEISLGISTILHACGIYGALYFKRWGVIVAGAAFALSFLLGLIYLSIVEALVAALFLYPHYFLYKLMKDGIVTEENYHKTANCCGDRSM